MRNLVHRTYDVESIKNEFLNIGFSEEAIDFVFLHNDNYNFEFLKEKLINVEKNLNAKIDSVKSELNTKIDAVEKNLNAKIDNVEKNLNLKIDNLDDKINYIKNELNTKIDSVNNKVDYVKNELISKIDSVEKGLNEKLNTGNRLIHFMILTAAILGPILNALFIRYLQYIK
ncbi:Bdr family repetitive protein (plasmid) [Borreliella andersonii]|uniref:Bdr family repetitive protein n=1 Tax=Borrelia andersonii TaxID=42109 RepID=A0ACD5G6E5_BORAD